jgi:hypothetical protein
MSGSKYDAVLSYHVNPYTCGVAKWNLRLANELGIPIRRLNQRATHPIVSIKLSEIPKQARVAFAPPYDLILHDDLRWNSYMAKKTRPWRWVREAESVWTVTPEMSNALSFLRPDARALPCPSTIETPRPRAATTYLTFGMANKMQKVRRHFEAFRDQVSGQDYTILLSLGVHEGSPWDDSLESSASVLRQVFGDRLEVLGFLSDAAIHREIEAATACVAFYDPAIRANNTTAWAVLERGKRLFTNFDDASPLEFRLGYVPTWQDVTTQLAPRAAASTTPAASPQTRSESPDAHRVRLAPAVSARSNPAL